MRKTLPHRVTLRRVEHPQRVFPHRVFLHRDIPHRDIPHRVVHGVTLIGGRTLAGQSIGKQTPFLPIGGLVAGVLEGMENKGWRTSVRRHV